jgi:hypothetical protein
MLSKSFSRIAMNRSTRFSVAVLLAALLFPCANSFGWISTGHKVVALIAWEDLTPKTRSAITAILQQHQRYDKDLLLDAPADETPDERARTAFATAATWPDVVRSRSNPMNFTHNHPAWHYIDIPFNANGFDPTTQPSTRPAVDANAQPGPHNAIEALLQCTAELKDPKISDADKAVDICWVEHLIGDIHQPLHAVSMYSKDHPDGDKGGNDDIVLRDPPYPDSRMNLHLLWDSLPGDFKSEELCIYEAQGLHNNPKYSREKFKDRLAVTDFMAWAKESHQLAVDDAYLNGKLETGTNSRGRGRGGDASSTPGVPPGYMANAEHIALQQVTIAGYRLADQLNSIFDPQK